VSPAITPIPGATRVETARSVSKAAAVRLTDQDRAMLLERFPARRTVRPRQASCAPAVTPIDGEVVLIMGLPGAGKTTIGQAFVARGYARVNRDEEGGALRDLLPALDGLVASGQPRIVVDNTYVSRKSRASLLDRAVTVGLPVRCLWLSTSIEDAQVNAVWRMLATYGRLLDPEETRKAAKTDPNAFLPGVQFRYQRELEPPDSSEGFSRVDVVTFDRVFDASFTNRAVIVWCDNVLARSRTGQRAALLADDVELIGQRAKVLRRYEEEGWRILGLSWRPEVGEDRITTQQADAGLARMQEMLGVAIDVQYCPHGGGPPVCWCRKPLPGLGVAFIRKYRLDPSQCLYVGAGTQDPGFARRLGFQYRDAPDFFGQVDELPPTPG
jgi:histidinol phosphatase-like enzyme